MLREKSCHHHVWQMGDLANLQSNFFMCCIIIAIKLTSLEGWVNRHITPSPLKYSSRLLLNRSVACPPALVYKNSEGRNKRFIKQRGTSETKSPLFFFF